MSLRGNLLQQKFPRGSLVEGNCEILIARTKTTKDAEGLLVAPEEATRGGVRMLPWVATRLTQRNMFCLYLFAPFRFGLFLVSRNRFAGGPWGASGSPDPRFKPKRARRTSGRVAAPRICF